MTSRTTVPQPPSTTVVRDLAPTGADAPVERWLLGGPPLLQPPGRASTLNPAVTTAADLIQLKDAFYAASAVAGAASRAGTLTRSHADAVTTAGARVDAACEAYRQAHHPKAGRVICALGQVLVLSRGGRSAHRVEVSA